MEGDLFGKFFVFLNFVTLFFCVLCFVNSVCDILVAMYVNGFGGESDCKRPGAFSIPWLTSPC